MPSRLQRTEERLKEDTEREIRTLRDGLRLLNNQLDKVGVLNAFTQVALKKNEDNKMYVYSHKFSAVTVKQVKFHMKIISWSTFQLSVESKSLFLWFCSLKPQNQLCF